ncbi:ubiquitin family protein [Arthroderma uncinatum]|uniref:ubiquitin family protein n=1 Tax=Arthroderma uncinatum TaxID=74035 RepID=UPI00144ACC26|nr:ubiquitin family protein [Arthroderma uncinatum]KAF3481122.1 ubiquitin family protein [Arthroderma uncinatum]
MHLVLPPSTASVSSSSLESKVPSSSSGVPYDHDARSNVLRYRGSQGSNDNSVRGRPAGHATPPEDDPGLSTINEQGLTQNQDRTANNTSPLSHRFNPTTGIWERLGQANRSQNPRTPHESRSSTAFSSPQNPVLAPPTGSPPVLPRQQSQQPQPLLEQQQQPFQPRLSRSDVPEPPQPLPAHRTASYLPNQAGSNHHGSTSPQGSESRRYRLSLVVRSIITMESQLHGGVIPRVDEISAARSQLYQHLDEQHRSPLEPRDVPIEGWITRVSNLATRADHLRLMRARNQSSASSQRASSNPSVMPNGWRNTPYLVVSPSGYQGIILPPSNSLPASVSRATTTHFLPPAIPFNPNGGVRHINPYNPPINQGQFRPQNRNGVIIRGTTLFRVVRAIWLFIRLYFFCYILSDSGSWLRIFLVTLAVVWACLSETDIPQQIRRAVLTPIRHHVEGLFPVPHGPAQPPRGGRDANDEQGSASRRSTGNRQPTNEQEAPQGRDANVGFWQRNRGIERGIALFLASLIPGISERQIEAMNFVNAARENAERSRQERENRAAQQDRDAAAQQEPNVHGEQADDHQNRDGQHHEV